MPSTNPADLWGQIVLALPAIQKTLQESIASVEKAFGGRARLEEFLADAVQRAAAFREAFPEIERRFDAVTRAVLVGLLDYSWYTDGEMPYDEFDELAVLLEAQNRAEIDRRLAEHYTMRLAQIEEELTKRHPGRARIITEAFAAHRAGKYALSVPVFLAQADGISRELLGAEYFCAGKSRPRAEKLLMETIHDGYLEACLRALTPKGTIRRHSSEVASTEFNRHAVMHGENVAYDNELNSLKAVSLLCFMSSTAEMKGKHDAQTTTPAIGPIRD